MIQMLQPRFNRNAQEKAAYMRAIARKAFLLQTNIWCACSWPPDLAWIAEWYPPECWLSDLSVNESVLFALFIAEALESEALDAV